MKSCYIYFLWFIAFDPTTGGLVLYLKYGYARNLHRLKAYYTHNPAIVLVQTVTVYKKTRHRLERRIHRELEDRGLQRKQAEDGTITEWFVVPLTRASEFIGGFSTLKTCKGRKVTHYENGKAVHS
jgi:hypothetical protein